MLCIEEIRGKKFGHPFVVWGIVLDKWYSMTWLKQSQQPSREKKTNEKNNQLKFIGIYLSSHKMYVRVYHTLSGISIIAIRLLLSNECASVSAQRYLVSISVVDYNGARVFMHSSLKKF